MFFYFYGKILFDKFEFNFVLYDVEVKKEVGLDYGMRNIRIVIKWNLGLELNENFLDYLYE